MAYLDDKTLKTVGNRCLHIREDYNKDRLISQREFASELNISHSRVSLIEKGKTEMTLTELHAYQNLTGYSYDYFMGKAECKDADNDKINKRIRLDDKAIRVMEQHRNDNIYIINTLNFLLSSNKFWDFISILTEYCYSLPIKMKMMENSEIFPKLISLFNSGIKEAENAGNTKRAEELKKENEMFISMFLISMGTNKKSLPPEKMDILSLFEISELAKEIAKDYQMQTNEAENSSTTGRKKK